MSQSGVEIATVVEEKQVDYVPLSVPTHDLPGPGRSRCSPNKGTGKTTRSPVKLPPVRPPKWSLSDDPIYITA